MGDTSNDRSTVAADTLDSADTVGLPSTASGAPSARDVPPPGTFIGRYVVEAPVGSGGMADVVAAHDPLLNRTVALKLLAVRGEAARVGLMREAQAMARIRHPNVVPVYDFGEYAGGVFLTMEYVEGGTLRAWSRGAPRGEKAVVAMFMAAGRGLAAAHRAGLVHRDFKPENVLIDAATSEARVTDFGLAHATGAATVQVSVEGACSGPADLLGPPVTGEGSVEGTPLYMAPEQHLAKAVDARADQFGFCIALFEALAGERPFRGPSRAELVSAMELGKVDAAASRKIPAWVLPVLTRGLSWRAEDRHASMDALLAELARDPAPRRRRRVAAAVAVVALLGSGAAYWQHGRSLARRCQLEGNPARESWSAAAQNDARAAFMRSNVPDAEAAWERTRAVVDAYVATWSTTAAESCVATVVLGRQTEAVYGGRRACLDRRAAELAQLTRVLADADADLVRHSFDAASSLSSLATCSDPEALFGAGAPPPPDARSANHVNELRRTLAEAKALNDAERGKDGLARAEPVVTEARRIGFAPLVAEALIENARSTLRAKSDAPGAAAQLEEAYTKAIASRSFGTAGSAAAELTSVVGHVLGRHREGHTWARLGDAALGSIRGVDADDIRIRQLIFETYVYNEEEAAADAVRTATEAARLAGERLETEPRLNIRLHVAAGVAYATGGDLVPARKEFSDALASATRFFGPRDPAIADRLSDLAAIEFADARFDVAAEQLDRAVAINESARSPDHINVAINLLNRSETHRFNGHCDLALVDYDRSRTIFVNRLGADATDLLAIETGAAECLRRTGRLEEGLLAIARAERLAGGGEAAPANVAEMRFVHAKLLADRGDPTTAAIELARKAADYYAKGRQTPVERIVRAEIDAWLAQHASIAGK
jgi:tetratricopeptide (TPR) repeat protein